MGSLSDGNWVPVAEAPAHDFHYAYKVDSSAPGAFLLTTEFNVDISRLTLATYYIQARLDGAVVAQTPLTLRGF